MIIRSLSIAVMLLAGPAAQAQTKEELAKRVIELQRPAIENVARSTASLPVSQLMQAAAQAVRRLPADQREAVGKQLEGDVRKFHAEVEALLRERAISLAPATLQPILLERFSEGELKQLVAWLDSPVARKYQEVSPELSNALNRKLVAETRAEIEPKLKALQQSLNQRLAAARPASAASGASK